VDVPERELAVQLQQREDDAPEHRTAQRARRLGRRRQRRLVRPRWPTSPARRHGWPEPLVDLERLPIGSLLPPHPGARLAVELVELVDRLLPPPFEHVTIDPRHPDGHPCAGVRIVHEPAMRGWQGTVGSGGGWSRRHRHHQLAVPRPRSHHHSWLGGGAGRQPVTPMVGHGGRGVCQRSGGLAPGRARPSPTEPRPRPTEPAARCSAAPQRRHSQRADGVRTATRRPPNRHRIGSRAGRTWSCTAGGRRPSSERMGDTRREAGRVAVGRRRSSARPGGQVLSRTSAPARGPSGSPPCRWAHAAPG
jgi:hypothetical protein